MPKYRRIIPVLLLSDGYLVKPVKFGKPQYIGDPINAVKIFNEMEADELVLLDTDPSRNKGPINFKLIEDVASEAFMPVAYGGGIVKKSTGLEINRLGIEKIVLGTSAVSKPDLISELSEEMGSQGVVVCIDYKTKINTSKTYINCGSKRTNLSPIQSAAISVSKGAGELIIQNINREGTKSGYDLSMLKSIHEKVDVPISILGGAGAINHFKDAFEVGASAACAGTVFVTNGPHKAVLISYPDSSEADKIRGFVE